MTDAKRRAAPRAAGPRSQRDGLERLIEALDAARGPLGDLEAVSAAGGDGRAELVVATTAALGVFEAAGRFLEAAADERREPPAKYRVTCPECGAESITEWTDDLPPGGVSPVECSACGYMILPACAGGQRPHADRSESDPVLVPE